MTRVGFSPSGVTGTQDVDIKTLGGSLVPYGPLPVEIESWDAGTLDVDIKTLGGSVVPYGPLPITGTVDITGLGGTLDVDIKTIGGSVVPPGPLPITGTVDVTGLSLSGTLDVDIKTLGGSLIPAGPLPTQANIYGYDGSAWDALKTTDAISAGTIDEGLLGAGIVERNHYCVALFSSTTTSTAGSLVPSSQYDISKFYTKTICHYVNGATSTIQVYARCCSGDTMRKYYEDTNVTSTQFITISFTEALHDAYVQVQVTSTLGTIDTSMAMQT